MKYRSLLCMQYVYRKGKDKWIYTVVFSSTHTLKALRHG